MKNSRQYLYIARYAVLPVANASSEFGRAYSDAGLNTQLIKQVYFHDLYADKEKELKIKTRYAVYTRLQRAGAPIGFTKYFGFTQKDIKGKAIAGADEHLLKALLRDSTAVSYLPMPLIYDRDSGKAVKGIAVLPVDLDENGKLSDSEKIYGHISSVIATFENKRPQELKNIPIGYLHLSIGKADASAHAVDFLKWVAENGQKYLHQFGYLSPDERLDKEPFTQSAVKPRGQ